MDYRVQAEALLSVQMELQLASIERQLSKLSRGVYFALQYLSVHGGTAHPRELSRGMEVSSARVAAMLNRMEVQGLVRREADAADNRQIVIYLTEKGARFLQELWEKLVGDIACLLEALGPEDTAAYLRIRHRMADILRGQMQPPHRMEDDTGEEGRALV